MFQMDALDLDRGVHEAALNEREKSADTSIALAIEMHFSSKASESAKSKNRTGIESDSKPDTNSSCRSMSLCCGMERSVHSRLSTRVRSRRKNAFKQSSPRCLHERI